MKRLPIIAGAAATAVLAGTLLGVPAIAQGASSPSSSTNSSSTNSSSTTSTAPLTAKEQAAVDGFLADHPLLAHALADRATAWDGFLTAHPDIAAEIAKVRSLPADQRRAEIKKWLTSHPGARTAIRDWRGDLRTQRQERRQDRRTQRQTRRGDTGAASTTSSSV
jgi:hemophore-related protein